MTEITPQYINPCKINPVWGKHVMIHDMLITKTDEPTIVYMMFLPLLIISCNSEKTLIYKPEYYNTSYIILESVMYGLFLPERMAVRCHQIVCLQFGEFYPLCAVGGFATVILRFPPALAYSVEKTSLLTEKEDDAPAKRKAKSPAFSETRLDQIDHRYLTD